MDSCGPLVPRASQTSKQRARVCEIAKFTVCLPCRQPIPEMQPWHFRARSVMEHALPETTWLCGCALQWQPRFCSYGALCAPLLRKLPQGSFSSKLLCRCERRQVDRSVAQGQQGGSTLPKPQTLGTPKL